MIMLPVEKAKGKIFLQDKFLCDVEYHVSEPLKQNDELQVQHVTLTVEDEHCVPLLAAYDLVLVVADGRRFSLPRPIQRQDRLECYVQSPQQSVALL